MPLDRHPASRFSTHALTTSTQPHALAHQATGSQEMPYSFVTIHPTFSILDKEKTLPIMAEFVEACSWLTAGDDISQPTTHLAPLVSQSRWVGLMWW